MNLWDMLAELVAQDQFELVIPNQYTGTDANTEVQAGKRQKIRLVYLMNDAVESFLVFEKAVLTGEYHPEFEGEITALLSGRDPELQWVQEIYSDEKFRVQKKDDGENILVVHQGSSVFTIFYEKISTEVHLYNYGEVGHFWVEGYENLRQLEYRLAILRDKYVYLGEEYCNSQEIDLASLAYFPPLSACCYPAVPEKYLVPREDPWTSSEYAIDVMLSLAEEVKDHHMVHMLQLYRTIPSQKMAKKIAKMLHRSQHAELVDLVTARIKEAAAKYPNRVFDEEIQEKYRRLQQIAEDRKRQLERQGAKAEILREEPFIVAKDSIDLKVYVMSRRSGLRNQKITVEEIKEYAGRIWKVKRF